MKHQQLELALLRRAAAALGVALAPALGLARLARRRAGGLAARPPAAPGLLLLGTHATMACFEGVEARLTTAKVRGDVPQGVHAEAYSPDKIAAAMLGNDGTETFPDPDANDPRMREKKTKNWQKNSKNEKIRQKN